MLENACSVSVLVGFGLMARMRMFVRAVLTAVIVHMLAMILGMIVGMFVLVKMFMTVRVSMLVRMRFAAVCVFVHMDVRVRMVMQMCMFMVAVHGSPPVVCGLVSRAPTTTISAAPRHVKHLLPLENSVSYSTRLSEKTLHKVASIHGLNAPVIPMRL